MIGRVLFRLGLLTGCGGIAVLAHLSFGQAVVPIKELNRVTAVAVIGAVMMAASIAIDLILYFKGRRLIMLGEWSVISQIIDGEKIFRVYRLLNVNGIDHSGNREYRGGLFSDETAAQEFADELNREE